MNLLFGSLKGAIYSRTTNDVSVRFFATRNYDPLFISLKKTRTIKHYVNNIFSLLFIRMTSSKGISNFNRRLRTSWRRYVFKYITHLSLALHASLYDICTWLMLTTF